MIRLKGNVRGPHLHVCEIEGCFSAKPDMIFRSIVGHIGGRIFSLPLFRFDRFVQFNLGDSTRLVIQHAL